MTAQSVTHDSDSGIYQITNIITSDFYIGSAKSFKQRWARHIRELERNEHHNARLQRAWLKYGSDAFTFIKLKCCSKADLICIEQEYLDTRKPTYNLCPRAGNPSGQVVSDETRKKLSIASTGKKRSPEICAKMSEISKNMSAETRARISRSLTGRKDTDAVRKKKSDAAIGKCKSDAMRQRMREVAAGRSPSHYENLRKSQIRSVICIETNRQFRSIKDAVNWLKSLGFINARGANITTCCKGNRNRAYGYHWQHT